MASLASFLGSPAQPNSTTSVTDQPGLVAHEIEEFVTSVRDVRYTQLVSFVTATIVIYDYIVCIDREIEFIWKKRWSVIKLAFLWHRYFGVLCVLFQVYALNSPFINDEHRLWTPLMLVLAISCSFWFYWETWGYCAVLFTSEAVLLLWIHVVYNKNRWILTLMGTCYVAEVAGVVTILTMSFETFQAKAFGVPGLQYCVMTHIGAPFSMLWVPILGYDALLLLLFLYRGCAGASSNSSWRWAYNYDGLLDMIYRHSLLNFLAIFGSYLACAVIWLTADLGLYQTPVCFALALSITNCTRLLLNIRRAYYNGVHDPILFNIREIPPTGTNTPLPHLLDVPMSPLSPIAPVSAWVTSSAASGISGLSGPTLRAISATPTSTLTLASPTPPSTARMTPGHDNDHDDDRRSIRGRTKSVSPVGTLRVVTAGPRHAHEYDPHERSVHVSSQVHPEWWQYELREMRVDPRVSYGEAV